MNLDDLKSSWNDNQSPDIKLETEMLRETAASGPLERIRRNMRRELIAQGAGVVVSGFVPFQLHFRTELLFAYYVLYAVLLAICVYYFVKFYWLYKRISDNSASAKSNLYGLYYDVRINIEMYKTFSYSLIPFVLIFLVMITVNTGRYSMAALMSGQAVYVMAGIFILVMVLIGFGTELWVNHFYGKYVKQLKSLLDQLEEEKES